MGRLRIAIAGAIGAVLLAAVPLANAVPPGVTIDSAPSNPTTSATADFTFSSADITATFDCDLDGTGAPCTSAKTYSGLGDGSHTFTVVATNADPDTSSASFSWLVDTTPPVLTLADTTVDVPNYTAPVPVTYTATSSEGAISCSPSSGSSFAIGPTNVSCSATDAANNSSSGSFTVTVTDTTPPVLTDPGNRTVEADGPGGTRVMFAVSGSDGGLALLPGVVECSPASSSTFPLGRTTATCSAHDAGGNVGTVSFDITVRDTTAPSINAPDASFTATDASGIARTNPAVAAYLAGISASDLVSSTTVTTTTPVKLPIGATRIVVTASDAADNQSQRTVTLTILEPGKKAPAPDFTPPGPVRSAKAVAGDGKVVLTWVSSTAADLKSIRITRTTVGSAVQTTVYTGLASTFTNRALKNSVTYRFVIVAFDRAGNSSQPVVVSATPVALLLASPNPGARVAKAPLLRWARVPTSKYFNVQLYRGGKKVLSAWPPVPRLQVKTRWSYDKRQYILRPGIYTWYVWPGVDPRSAARYGPLLGKSSFVVTVPRV